MTIMIATIHCYNRGSRQSNKCGKYGVTTRKQGYSWYYLEALLKLKEIKQAQ